MVGARVRLIVTVAGAAVILGGCKSEKRDAPSKPAPSAASSSAASSSPSSAPAAVASPAPAAPIPPTNIAGFSTPDDYTSKAATRIDLASGLVIEDLKVGQGDAVLPRALVTFHYRGKIDGDREFDCTLTRPDGPKPEVQPLNKLFKGLADGMIGMQKGGRRRLTIPPHLAPGIVGLKDVEGNTLIPPAATLIYVVDMVDIQPPPVTPPPPAAPAPAAAPGQK